MTTFSRKPFIEKMRNIPRPHIAAISGVRPHKPLTPKEHESIMFLIENTHALLRVVDGYDDMMEEHMSRTAPAQALLELHRDHPDIPQIVWDSFVKSETAYLAQDA